MTVSRHNGQETTDVPGLDLARLAELVAGDEINWPNDLSDRVAKQLTHAVRERRRARLISIIAHQITDELERDQR